MIIRRIASSPSAGKGAKRGGAPMPKQMGWPLNTPGQDFDFSQFLGQGRTTVVYFYADWCPACRNTSPLMQSINRSYEDIEVLPLDIAEWGSPVAALNGINFVPYYQIYDKSGKLIAEGKPASEWLAHEVRRRTGLK
jgi:thiol-disulfide isomerase/thioredoxin